MLVKELIYSILDLAKASTSDDSFYTEEHVFFLAKKYRSFLIKREKDKLKLETDLSGAFENQEICLNFEKVPAIDGTPCTGGYYLKSVEKIPKMIEGLEPSVYPIDFYQGIHINYVSRDRMRYIGSNPYLRNITFISLGPDNHFYLNSNNPQFLYLKKLRVSAAFEDFEEVAYLLCDKDGADASCDPLDMEFPIRSYLVPELIQMVVKDLTGAKFQPKDNQNNAKDDLSEVRTK